MEFKKELVSIIEIIKAAKKITQAQISVGAGYHAKYFSELLSRPEDVPEKVIDNLRRTYKDELQKEYVFAEGDKNVAKELAQLKALGKVLFHELALLKADREKLPIEEVIYRLNQSTTTNLLTLIG